MAASSLLVPGLVLVVAFGAELVPRVVAELQARRTAAVLAAGARRPVRAVDEYVDVDTAELVRRSELAVAELGEALRDAQDDLPLTRVHLGQRRADELETVLADARAAHVLVDGLRDSCADADDERAVRDAATQALRACREPVARLAAQRSAIDAARAIADDVGAALDALVAEAARLRGTVGTLRTTLTALAVTHPPGAVAAVAADLDRAAAVLAHVDETLGRGRQRAVAGAAAGAVGSARVAQEALARATRLLASVASADAELTAATAELGSRVASVAADLADVERLAPDDPQVAGPAREARDAWVGAEAARSGAGDPRSASRRLAAAQAVLAAALSPHRDAEVRRRHAASLVDGVLARLDVDLRAARQYVGSHPWQVVGQAARQRVAQAERLQALAVDGRAAGPERSLADARRALALVEEAESLARRDVRAAQDGHALTARTEPAIRVGWHPRTSERGDDGVGPPVPDERAGSDDSLLGRLTGWDGDPGDDRRDPWYG